MTPRGGARKGAGRPATGKTRETVAVTIPRDLVTWSADEARARGTSRSELVAQALDTLRSGTTPAGSAARELDEPSPPPISSAAPSLDAEERAELAELRALVQDLAAKAAELKSAHPNFRAVTLGSAVQAFLAKLEEARRLHEGDGGQ